MRHIARAALAMSLTLCIALPARAAWKTAGDLVEGARMNLPTASSNDPNHSWWKDGTFYGYVFGVFDANEDSLCVPENTKAFTVRSVVALYILNHPEQWSDPAAVVVMRALRAAFPCR